MQYHAINTDGESMAKFINVLVLTLVLIASQACAGSIGLNSSLRGYLSTYIPNATLQSASYYNMTLSRSTYVIMQLSAGSNRFVVINTTGHAYSIMLASSNISRVLWPFVLGRYYPNQSTLDYLNTSMRAYRDGSSSSIGDCLEETGLNRFNCTTANSCFSCRTVPICSAVISSLGGPGSQDAYPFVNGITTFSSQYVQLNASYSTYFSTLSALSPSSISTSISTLSGVLSTISTISVAMPQNPLFPLPSNTNFGSLYASCGAYSNYNQPWYCVDVGLCKYVSFNSTLLSGMQSTVTALQASPLSSAGLSATSANSSSIARGYVLAVVSRQENASFSAFLNATEPRYNLTVQKSQTLLNMFSNSVLATSLGTLKSAFATILGSGPSQNMTYANVMMVNALSNINIAYSRAYAAFLPVYNLEQSNNRLLDMYGLSYERIPASIARLSIEQQELNARIDAGVNSSQLPSVLSELRSVNAGLSVMTFNLGSVAKAFDGAMIGMALGGASALSAKNSNAVLLATAISLVIGAAIVLLFYFGVYHRLKSKNRIKFHRRARTAWRVLFVLMGIALIVYVAETYLAASGANTLLPVSGFLNAVTASKSVAIMLNGTGAGAFSCASSVEASLNSTGKTVYVISITNGTCSGANSSFVGACTGSVAGRMPIVFISGGNSSIVYRGMYGHVLYASGAAASGSSCALGALFLP